MKTEPELNVNRMKCKFLFIVFLVLLMCHSCRSHKKVSCSGSRDLLHDITSEIIHHDSTCIDTQQDYELTIEYYSPVTEDSAHAIDLMNFKVPVTEASPNAHHGAVRRVIVKTGQKSHVTRTTADTTAVVQHTTVKENTEEIKTSDTKPATEPIWIILLVLAGMTLMTKFRNI